MDWAVSMAKQVKRPQASPSPWWIGRVVSPIREIDPQTGAVKYHGQLIVKVGEFTLMSDRLTLLDHYDQLYDGLNVALIGNIPGNQNFLIVGVLK